MGIRMSIEDEDVCLIIDGAPNVLFHSYFIFHPPVWERVRKEEELGFVTGRSVDIDGALRLIGLTVYTSGVTPCSVVPFKTSSCITLPHLTFCGLLSN